MGLARQGPRPSAGPASAAAAILAQPRPITVRLRARGASSLSACAARRPDARPEYCRRCMRVSPPAACGLLQRPALEEGSGQDGQRRVGGWGARQSEAGLEGFEPSTAGLRVRCSTWLSHRPGTGCAGRYYKRCMRSGSGASGGPCAPRRPERPCNAPSGRQMGGRSKRPRRAAAYCRGPGTVGATRASSYLSSIELRTTETGTLFMRFFSAKSFW